ncbi:hypothetical protein BIFGAL_02703 [Bifidobacterium gallicum DSM 20093 = LMG 11596]|uniref:Uncharacterized protein n=1 Tax=Bifidobacterium gallicum DSM 20093 = LMG 11596 TaxID=561180 RepID=D1NSE6_9BIFI|nr:hypothetical protein BIFGAL_02703 [Bifidobacterium gallicum DSM 20093 = LMG 11596]
MSNDNVHHVTHFVVINTVSSEVQEVGILRWHKSGAPDYATADMEKPRNPV